MVSVCMGIYNGEKYIKEQLISILHQTRQPDEVILRDDGSSDGSLDIVRNFLSEHGLDGKWKLHSGEVNLGYPHNFYYAMGSCTGDIVFLADQDDIWDVQKLEQMCVVFDAIPQALAVCCKFGLIDGQGGDIHTIMAPVKSKRGGKPRQVAIEDVFYKCEWPGMVLAYRRKWLDDLLKGRLFPIPHDFLVCAWAAEAGGFYQMEEELAWHRRHENNTGGEEHRMGRLLNRERKLHEINQYIRILNQFQDEKIMQTERGKSALDYKMTSMTDRLGALESGNASRVLKNAWKHRKQVRAVTFICDMIIAFRTKK